MALAKRDLFPGALEMMILHSLMRRRCTAMRWCSTSSNGRMIFFRWKKARFTPRCNDC